MIIVLKVAGFALAFFGLVINLLEVLGKFRDPERLEFARLLQENGEDLPRSTRGFERFLDTFPPPKGVEPSAVTHTTKDVVQTHDGFPISITVRYVANGQRTAAIASRAEVVAWSEKTRQKWWSFGIGIAGWTMVFIAFVLETLCRAN